MDKEPESGINKHLQTTTISVNTIKIHGLL